MARPQKKVSLFKTLIHYLMVVLGACALTLVFFLVLPLMQTINKPLTDDLTIQTVDIANVPPPPPPVEEEPEEEPEPEEQPPQLDVEAQPLDLSQLETLINPGFGGSGLGPDLTVTLKTFGGSGGESDALFSLADLDQKPRVVYQPGPIMNKKLRKKAPATVYILFVVEKNGRVQNPIVQKSTDPIFNKPALAAVKQWKFEPGKRNGKPVRFRMRVPITFPKG